VRARFAPLTKDRTQNVAEGWWWSLVIM